MTNVVILLASSDPSLQEAIPMHLNDRARFRVESVPTAEAALSKAASPHVGVAIFHVERAGDALCVAHFLHVARSSPHPVPTLVLLEQRHDDIVLRLAQMGAVECLCRPLDFGRLALLIETLTRRHFKARCAATVQVTGSTDHPQKGRAGSIDTSSAMRSFMERVGRVARVNTTVLLSGETGSGKTHLARQIHGLSPRADKPLIHVNCGALSPTLVESELFGHVKGAFTGADREFQGKFAQAADGTLFLDEIDCLTLEAQAKFLRVVEERVYEPLGSGRRQTVAARLIVATNRSLEAEAAAGRFRTDLMYRLNVVSFAVPPLRERREEIRPLAMQLLAAIAGQHGFPLPHMMEEALAAFEAYDWPGNVRELRNVIEHALIMCANNVISVAELPPAIQQSAHNALHAADQDRPVTGNVLACARNTAEKTQLIEALKRNNNNRSSTAIELGISRVALYKKLHKYGLASRESD